MIGEGAFGRVYRGLDRRLARTVAVKVIKPWWAEDTAWVERFQREAQLLARVSDPGIVQIFDIGHAEEGPYYVAELVDGESLAERLLGGPLEPEQARELAEQLCDALASAHAQGVVHCDVKPANVLLARDGTLKVGDFGVARLAGGTSQALASTVAGTPRYMSPEQARGRPTSTATDVYSAGVVLYEMLSGEPPFMHGSAVELGLRHLQDPPAPLPEHVPLQLREIVGRALAKNPSERWRDGAQMASALRALQPVCQGVDASSPFPTEVRAAPGIASSGATALIDEQATVRVTASERQAAATKVVPRHSQPAEGPGRVYRRRRLALGAAVLAAFAGALIAAMLASASGHTTVPDLRGLPRGGVQARAKRLDVHPAFLASYSESTPGIAIAQYPPAGSHVSSGSTVRVTLSAGPPPVSVPSVVGKGTQAAQEAISDAGLRFAASEVVAPSTSPGVVVAQSPTASREAPRGSTVALSVAETPRWRALTTFSGVDDGQSVLFRILGREWRVLYSMSYTETCELIFVCSGPSAKVHDAQGGPSFGSFELGEGSEQTHTFNSGPGLYSLDVSGGNDRARWTMTVEDYY